MSEIAALISVIECLYAKPQGVWAGYEKVKNTNQCFEKLNLI